MKRILTAAALAALTLAPAAWADEWTHQEGRIIDLRVSSKALPYGNPTHIKLEGQWHNQPACAGSGFWSFDSDTPAGKALLDTALAAYLAGRKLKLYSFVKPDCTLRGDMAVVSQMDIH